MLIEQGEVLGQGQIPCSPLDQASTKERVAHIMKSTNAGLYTSLGTWLSGFQKFGSRSANMILT